MKGYINNFDFLNMSAQKYWSFPSSYDVKKRKEQLNLILYSDDYVASEKKDGYWQMILKDEDGNVFMRARNSGVNGWVCKQDWVPHIKDYFDALPNGTCLISEVFLPGKTSKDVTTILGCKVEKAVERQTKNKLYLSVFDIIAYNGKLLYNEPITERIKYFSKLPTHDFVIHTTYWDSPDDIKENWLRILEEGGEGVVLTRKNNPYEFGKRTARNTLKLKKELKDTIDAFLTGKWKAPTREYSGTELLTWPYWENEITGEKVHGTLDSRVHNEDLTPVTKYYFNGWAAAIEVAVLKDGKVTPIGWISNIPDEVRESIVNSDDLKGAVVELQAMEIDNSGDIPTMRHAKIINWRSDKTWKDCIWSY